MDASSFIIICLFFLKFGQNTDLTYIGDRYVEEGSSFTFKCMLSHFNTFQLTKDGKEITKNEYNKTEVEDYEKKVRIITISVDAAVKNHSGEYKCDRFSVDSHHIEVVYKYDEKEVFKVLEIGKPLELKCNVDPRSLIPVNWLQNEKIVISGSKKYIKDHKLIITEAKEEDSGIYKCMIGVSDNFKASKNSGLAIKVYSKAKVDPLPSQISVVLGRQLELRCNTRGFPIPRLMWFINDVSMQDLVKKNNRYEMKKNDAGLMNSILIIKELENEDSGEYRCRAKNPAGEVNTTTSITLRESAMQTNKDTNIDGLIINYREPLVLKCVNADNINVDVKWTKNAKEIDFTDGHVKTAENNTLEIKVPTEADAGNYSCSYGQLSATITVRTRVRVTPFPKSRNLPEGVRLSLICKVSGVPTPTIKWQKNSKFIDKSYKRIVIGDHNDIENSELVIDSVEFKDRAKYTCIADNVVSSSNSTIMIRIKDKYAALWPFLGICAEVAVLCTIIFVYEKRRSKPDFTESDTDNSPDVKNASDQKGQELRQRK